MCRPLRRAGCEKTHPARLTGLNAIALALLRSHRFRGGLRCVAPPGLRIIRQGAPYSAYTRVRK
jgi:hypothetical protein